MSDLSRLRTLRDDLQARMVAASDRDFTAMGRLLKDVIAEIAAAESDQPEQKGTALDELNARRAARQSGAARQA